MASLCSHAVGKSPLRSLFPRCLKCLSPNFMVESSRSCELMFEKILEKLVSYKQLSNREADAAKLEFSNFLSTTVRENKDSFVKFDKEIDRVNTFIWQFFLDNNKFGCYERYSKCWWYCPMVKLPLIGDIVLMVKFWLKTSHGRFNCSETYPQSHAELWFVGSWFGYYTWIIGLCQFYKKTLFSEPEREIVGKVKVF